ncbi:helix-turn-helix transcriptional regulator [Brevibacillus laterosporus]|uniref:helix-turn-helix domain-containing protein n=1 Tax=Brevibacillus laterosporus TaxID=1465 RepID=UPI0030B9FC3E
MTLSELSRRTGVSKGIISKIESGETKRPELKNLKLIADTISYLMKILLIVTLMSNSVLIS